MFPSSSEAPSCLFVVSLLPQYLQITNRVSIPTVLLFSRISYKWDQTAFLIWLLSIQQNALQVIHVIACVCYPFFFIAEQYSIAWSYHSHFSDFGVVAPNSLIYQSRRSNHMHQTQAFLPSFLLCLQPSLPPTMLPSCPPTFLQKNIDRFTQQMMIIILKTTQSFSICTAQVETSPFIPKPRLLVKGSVGQKSR